MDISILAGYSGATSVDSLYGNQDKEENEQKNTINTSGQDLVTISPEAMEKLAALNQNSGKQNDQQQDGAGQGGEASGGGGSSGGNDSDSQIQSLRGQISALQGQLTQVSGTPDGASEAASISAQISQLMSELSSLEVS